jgi:hypothetical protein
LAASVEWNHKKPLARITATTSPRQYQPQFMEIKQAKPERIMNADSKEWIRFRQEYSAKNSEYELA